MKVLNLQCGNGHGFEGWFGSDDDFGGPPSGGGGGGSGGRPAARGKVDLDDDIPF